METFKPLLMTYLTDGFYPWALFFCDTLKAVVPDFDLILITKGLTEPQADSLRDTNGRIRVLNTPYDMERLARISGLSVNELMRQKEQIEKGYVTHKTRCWKLLHAGDDRVHAMHHAYAYANVQRFTHLVAFDVDTYFRKNFMPLLHATFEETGANILAKRRLGHSVIKARITIDMMGFKTDVEAVDEFFTRWRVRIANIAPAVRPVGYGQATCYHAYLESVKAGAKWGTLPVEFGLPGRLKEDQHMWTGNLHKKTKVEILEHFKEDFGRRAK